MRQLILLTAIGVFTAALFSEAYADTAGVSVTQAWSRATPGAVTTGVVYLTVTAKGAPDQLMGEASTPVAASAEMHETKTMNGMTQMAPVASLPVGPGTPVKLTPGGYHLMLMGLKQPLKAGDHFPLTLHFQHAGEITTTVTVERLGAAAPSNMSGMDMGNMH